MGIHSASDDEKVWLYTFAQCRQRHCSCSLSREYLLHRVLHRGPLAPLLSSLSYPACLAPLCLLSCVDSFDTAPPPQDLLAGLLYTAPPSTGDGSFDSYLSSP